MKRRILLILFFISLKAGAQSPAFQRSDSLFSIGSYTQAIGVLREITPASPEVHLRLARSYRAKGNLQKAIIHYRAVVENDPKDIPALVDYSELLLKTGKLDEADSIYSSLAKKFPDNANFQFELGSIREKRKDSTAFAYYRKAILLDSTHQDALLKMATEFLRQSNFSKAERFAKQGLSTNPYNVSLISILGQTYFNQKEFRKSIVPFERLLALGNNSQFVHSKLGMAFFRIGDFKKAITHYQKALDFEVENSSVHYMLGINYARIGEYEKSKEHLLTSIEIKDQPLDGEYLSLALTNKMTGNYKKALENLEKALEEDPKNERVLYERAIAADNYFADIQTRINYYQAYLNEHGETGNKSLIILTKRRIQDLKVELHMKQ